MGQHTQSFPFLPTESSWTKGREKAEKDKKRTLNSKWPEKEGK